MMSQRERIQTELEFLERMRGLRRRGQLITHREPQGLLLGGKQVSMCERWVKYGYVYGNWNVVSFSFIRVVVFKIRCQEMLMREAGGGYMVREFAIQVM